MNKNLSYKKKYKILLAALILGVLLIYSFTIKKTILLISDVNNAEAKIKAAKDAPERSRLLKKELKKIDNKIGSNNKLNENYQQSILELVTSYCKSHNTILREFPEVTEETKGGFIIETNRFVVEGNFSSLLSLIYILEHKNNLGKIASVEYSLKKDSKSREMALTATIYLQNIKKQ